jgi:hypothetical protein
MRQPPAELLERASEHAGTPSEQRDTPSELRTMAVEPRTMGVIAAHHGR